MAEQPRSRFLRQFAITQGRARSIGVDLPLDTLVQATAKAQAAYRDQRGEYADVVRLAVRPISIAEISAHLHVHLGIARVLVSDLAAQGAVGVATGNTDEAGPDLRTLERLFDDLQAL
ncbi:MAG: DUF742 domain-containing protein [Acidimicrobiia bacterium]|nr:DUF742 domain-containing protein [Acidimicrobiia bacterium]